MPLAWGLRIPPTPKGTGPLEQKRVSLDIVRLPTKLYGKTPKKKKNHLKNTQQSTLILSQPPTPSLLLSIYVSTYPPLLGLHLLHYLDPLHPWHLGTVPSVVSSEAGPVWTPGDRPCSFGKCFSCPTGILPLWALRGPPPHFHTFEYFNEGTLKMRPLWASWRQPGLCSSNSSSLPSLLRASALRLRN